MASFSWGMHPDAERELNETTGVYGQRFEMESKQWLSLVAGEAAKGKELDGGFDPALPPALHYVTSELLRTWLFAPRLFFDKTFLEQIEGLAHAARTRRPPFEYWATEKYFPDVASSFEHKVKAFFTVDRVRRRITFIKFTDLPGS